ncbi:Hypothetical predicted protein [Lecanosticta acicola]|uniref:BTB domain-containing protein n=1 Tax=Lecanosticta acicola TaxID=111012 RepID=A0AAI9E8W7_9PEZI|nr:Hypothetical predicted protein [Lecanosticta acicola]
MDTERERPAKRIKVDYFDEVKVKFAFNQYDCVVHIPRNLITGRSRHFEWACSHNNYGQDGVVKLPYGKAVNKQSFSTYLQILHSGQVALDEHDGHSVDSRWSWLIEVYILCDLLGDPESMNLVMDKLVLMTDKGESTKWKPILETVDSHTRGRVNPPLRRMLVDHLAERSCFSAFVDKSLTGGECPFLAEAAKEMAKRRDEGADAAGRIEVGERAGKKYHVEVRNASAAGR